MTKYTPRIVERASGPEQCFDANIVSVEDMDGVIVIALGDLAPRKGKPLNMGTPIHSLILQLDGDELTVELNDQGNQRSGDQVERFELSPSSFTVVFAPDEGPFAGRVSLSPEIELFDGDETEPSLQLRSVRVGLGGVSSQVERLRRALRGEDATAAKLVEVEHDDPVPR